MKTKLLNIIILIFSGLGIAACELNEKREEISLECEVVNPLKDLSWLNKKLENIKGDPLSGIILYRYNSREIIEIQTSLMSSTNISQYYCDGTKIDFEKNPELYQDFLRSREKVRILYGIDLWKL